MKRIIGALTTIVALGLALAGPAGAHIYSPTCGQNGNGNGVTTTPIIGAVFPGTNPATFEVDWTQKCGVGGTIEFELQRSRDEGQHWTTITAQGELQDFQIGTSQGQAGLDLDKGYFMQGGCDDPSDGWIRGKVWDRNPDGSFGGHKTSNKYVCA